MNNHEAVVSGVLRNSEMQREVRGLIEAELLSRIECYLIDEVIDAIFNDDHDAWVIVQEDLKQTAVSVLEGLVGHDRIDYSGAA